MIPNARLCKALIDRIIEYRAHRLEALRGSTTAGSGSRRIGATCRPVGPSLASSYLWYWLRKRPVRLLIEEIIATVKEAEPSIDLVIHWQGGKHTAVKIAKNRTGQHNRVTNREVVEVVRELARRLPDPRRRDPWKDRQLPSVIVSSRTKLVRGYPVTDGY